MCSFWLSSLPFSLHATCVYIKSTNNQFIFKLAPTLSCNHEYVLRRHTQNTDIWLCMKLSLQQHTVLVITACISYITIMSHHGTWEHTSLKSGQQVAHIHILNLLIYSTSNWAPPMQKATGQKTYEGVWILPHLTFRVLAEFTTPTRASCHSAGQVQDPHQRLLQKWSPEAPLIVSEGKTRTM